MDKKELDDYINRIEYIRWRQQYSKTRKIDEVDVVNNLDFLNSKSEQLSLSMLNRDGPRALNAYWERKSARDLFITIKDQIVREFLVWRAEVLGMAVDDDNLLVGLVQNVDNITNLTSKQQTSIRNKCLYLKNNMICRYNVLTR